MNRGIRVNGGRAGASALKYISPSLSPFPEPFGVAQGKFHEGPAKDLEG